MAGLGSTGQMKTFVDTYGLAFPTTVSEGGQLWARFGIFAQGQWVFVDASGRSEVVPYDLDEAGLRAKVESLLS